MRICVYMNIAGALPEAVTVSYQDNEWSQTLDYEHIPFRCRKYHVHGHLFRDFPLNFNPDNHKSQEGIDLEGFTKIQGKRKVGHCPGKLFMVEEEKSKNRYKSLEESTSEEVDLTQNDQKSKEKQIENPRDKTSKLDLEKNLRNQTESEIEMQDQEPQVSEHEEKNHEEGSQKMDHGKRGNIDIGSLGEEQGDQEIKELPSDPSKQSNQEMQNWYNNEIGSGPLDRRFKEYGGKYYPPQYPKENSQ
jgi:hypothetical protein